MPLEKKSMSDGGAEKVNRIAKAAGRFGKGNAEVCPGGVTKNDPPQGNPDHPKHSRSRKVGG